MPITVNNPLLDGIKVVDNYTRTQNNALTHKTSLNHGLDFFSRAGGLRENTDEALKLFQSAYSEDPDAALKTLFYTRDIRGGLGERAIFRACADWFSLKHPVVFNQLASFIPEYGRWDDVIRHYSLLSVRDLVRQQWELDCGLLANFDNSVSLLGKWLPSLSASNKQQKALAKEYAQHLCNSQRDYRHALSALRARIDIVEKRMCKKDWDGIDFSKVPSQAMRKLRKAFGRNNSDRFGEFLAQVEAGQQQIKAGTITPEQIFGEIVDCSGNPIAEADKASELQWKAIPVWGEPQNILPVIDCSASMTWQEGRAMKIARSMGIFCSERNATPAWAHRFITFADEPAFVEFDSEWTLAQKAKAIHDAEIGYSTNLHAVFRLILDTVVETGTHTLPDAVLIISDMEFNCGTIAFDETTFHSIDRMFSDLGFTRPNLVFWNVHAKTEQSPVTMDENGTALVSGCSPSVMQMAFKGDFSPMSVYREMVLDNPRYAQITADPETYHEEEDDAEVQLPDEYMAAQARFQEDIGTYDNAGGYLTAQQRTACIFEVENDTPLAHVCAMAINQDDDARDKPITYPF